MDVLKDQLRQLLLRVLHQGGALRHLQHRDFRPAQQPFLVAAVVGRLGMLVMGQPHRVRPHLPDQAEILPDLFRGSRRIYLRPVLMPGGAPQLMRPSVQEKPFLPVQLHLSEAGAQGHLIRGFPAAPQLRGQGVEGGLPRPVPELRFLNRNPDRFRPAALRLACGPACRVPQGIADAGLLSVPEYMGLRLQDSLPALVDPRPDDQSVGSVIGWIKADLPGLQQLRAAVQPAENREIPEGGSDVLVDPVIQENPDYPFLRLPRRLGDGQPEPGVSAPVFPREITVHIDPADLVRVVKGEEGSRSLRPADRLLVDRDPLPGLLLGEPGMRQIHRFPALLRKRRGQLLPASLRQPSETPFLIQFHAFHRFFSPFPSFLFRPRRPGTSCIHSASCHGSF